MPPLPRNKPLPDSFEYISSAPAFRSRRGFFVPPRLFLRRTVTPVCAGFSDSGPSEPKRPQNGNPTGNRLGEAGRDIAAPATGLAGCTSARGASRACRTQVGSEGHAGMAKMTGAEWRERPRTAHPSERKKISTKKRTGIETGANYVFEVRGNRESPCGHAACGSSPSEGRKPGLPLPLQEKIRRWWRPLRVQPPDKGTDRIRFPRPCRHTGTGGGEKRWSRSARPGW